MVLETPVLTSEDMDVLARLRTSRERLRQQVGERSPWERPLRRVQLGRAVRGSNSIEGYVVSLDDAVDAVDGEDSLDAEDETRLAVLGYRDALTYVLQVADDPTLTIDRNLIRSLHFLMLKHDLGARPGRWRAGPIYVHDERTDEIVYEGPSVAALDGLMSSYADGLEDPGAPREVRAAMAHLNLVMIHPFRDGNGRMARAVQTLALTGRGCSRPSSAASRSTWATTPMPTTPGPAASYRREADVTEQVASRELRLLLERGLLVAHGEKRGRTYSAGDELRDVAARAREQRSDDEHADPYRQPTLL